MTHRAGVPPETARLSFRQMAQGDLDFVADMLADPDVMRFYPQCYSRDEAATWIDRQVVRYERDGHGLWLVMRRDTGEPVGQIGLLRQRVGDGEDLEVGYLVHRAFWRRGYAYEAAAACRDHAFAALRPARVVSLIRPDNVPSQGVALKMGMNIVGETPHGGVRHLVFAVSNPCR